ncbi:CDP-glycerol glycerophosphotransferase family protein [uncultured Shewanella sp.]|uniref:CDP-glycerol glycerophosphotransferase family protein n=1 Tax=uncultured Shewanella sp. TaxID=173975 RepID=UPI00260D34FB|nr:CDP-glycerol glycerophosphotransferase family protein [uncultured Shewanella sp.]
MNIALFKGILIKILYTLSKFSPRNHNKAVFGSYKNRFTDNAKYLYLHWQQTRFIRNIWISGDKALINTLNKQGMEAYHRRSIKGIYHALTAKYFFYNSYIGDVNQYFANGAIKVNLWHGSPLKRIEFDIVKGPLSKVYHPKKQSYNLLHHQEYTPPDIILSPSKLTDKIFCSAFKLSTEALLRSTSPRIDFHHRYPQQQKTKQDIFNHMNIKETPESHLLLYTPSWRDKYQDKNPYKTAFDWETLSNKLVKSNSLLLIRLHPNEIHLAKELEQYNNVLDISHWEDVYSILGSVDLLITDYSSLFIDALQYNVPVIFYRFDKEWYESQCRENYDFVEKISGIGPEYTQFDELLVALNLEEKEKIKSDQHLPPYSVCHPFHSAYEDAKQHFWEPSHKDAFEHIETYVNQSQSR